MKEIINKIVSKYLKYRYSSIEKFIKNPFDAQDQVFEYLIGNGKKTRWGDQYDYFNIKNYHDFQRRVPVSVYDELKPWIQRMMHGERDVLWPGLIEMYSKSSGTTEDKSKFIPTSTENLIDCHIKGGWDAATILYNNRPDSKLFAYKNLLLGGSLQNFEDNPNIRIGDISALMMTNMPYLGKAFHTPDIKTALLPDWNQKIPLMSQIASKEDVSAIGGVPSWLLVLLKEILKITEKENLVDVWPNLEVFFHGGVNFAPYRKQFMELIPKEDFNYINVYNSSEGYFAIQDDLISDSDDMLLLLNSQIFFEFIPFDQYGSKNPDTFTIRDVELGVNYVILISTNSGMWRYVVGDTVEFTSLSPFKIRITGRTKHFINVFGEEVMVSNTDKALQVALAKHNALMEEYTVAPIFLDGTHKGGHQWLIEFSKSPADIAEFKRDLDLTLQSLNSDYEAKRFNDYVLSELELSVVPNGTFYRWMESRGKLGGQNKVPRLSNSRNYVENLLDFSKQQ
ncbi:MAG: GH3 auxin-responsive promoter family protein [Saprospiraceae bacterium]|nr:GH3 auxin-responsive promoter family protein [Saprospiraceae bacterium]